jgi:hypothetical protein
VKKQPRRSAEMPKAAKSKVKAACMDDFSYDESDVDKLALLNPLHLVLRYGENAKDAARITEVALHICRARWPGGWC